MIWEKQDNGDGTDQLPDRGAGDVAHGYKGGLDGDFATYSDSRE